MRRTPDASRRLWRVACTLAALALLPAPARADWSDFFPHPIWNGVYLDLSGSFERDELQGTRKLTWEDTYFKERLALESFGYFYHPRFLQYELEAGAALKQERFETTEATELSLEDGYVTDDGWDGNLRLALLPEHPYSFLAFASRFEPVFKEKAEVHHDSVETTYGATFRLRNRPYFLSAFYTNDTIDSGSITSEVEKVGADGQYFRQLRNERTLSFTGSASRSIFGRTGGLDGTLDEYHAGNLLNLGTLRLSSELTATATDQESEAGRYESEQFLWHERLDVTLPFRLRGDASYRYRDDQSAFQAPGLSERSLDNRGHDLELHLVHRLYESLDTTYTFLGNRTESSGGTSTALSHGLSFNYVKTIPRGHVLAGLSFGTADLESEGRGIDVVDEPHSGIAVPTSPFRLSQQNVDERSIAVLLRSPVPPNELILLVRGAHYSVTAIPHLNTFEILIFALPAEFVVPGTYDFLVSYSLTQGGFGITSSTLAGNVSVELFDNLLTPYVSYSVIGSDVTSGSFAGDPVDATTYVAGVRFRRDPFTATAEYEHVEAIVSPYDAYKGEVKVVHQWSRGTTINGTAVYQSKRYLEDQIGVVTLAEDTETRQSVAASVQQQLLDGALLLSLGGSYSRLQGIQDARATSADASLSWRIGKLDLSAGASTYAAETSGDRFAETTRDHVTLYFRIRRKIF